MRKPGDTTNGRGEIAIEYKGQPLAYTVYRQQAKQADVVTSKQITLKLDGLTPPAKKRKRYIPPLDHPWRRFRVGTKASPARQAGDISTR